ncbi:recombination regulator RecX [Meiothermus ruber]|jgi:regulatory protein|uniref:Regulatory protein RecX n=1 Tax=Meiothermus ruber (strain ATCC 35948 / DSM 1279 / VKM B-1258 / 21) TaxID=504728 RepID=D3PS38_MEIRD|nr:recombination regulator RecX [Meiothermus ruber]ADD28271.1 regulatory protein RecX [Meiothermus ruber DSM 1279]AGK06289.1 regulatory protein RecX [Meiothermus ruber DSM 1279]MCL6529647.1 recombination regulator RecX [Meiothermus ruber]
MKQENPDGLFLYAVRLLGARAYSEAALRHKLSRRAPPEVVEATLGRLKQRGYLDDHGYAEGYVRLYAGRWGAAKLRRALLSKGVSSETVDRVLAAQMAQQDPVEEALALLARYPSRHRGEKPRAIRFLTNRGYALAHALAAWARYLEQASP